MSIPEFIEANITFDNPILSAIMLSIIWMIVYDFYHALHSAVFSWFKRKDK